MKKGKIFVYPTDTIYGIGCDVTNDESVLMIRKLKEMDEKPFSVIAFGVTWIKKNCVIGDYIEEWTNKLPGPYTFVLELKNLEALSNQVNKGMDNVGVRIPDHWFSKTIEEYGKPFVTNSVNLSGEPFMKKMDDLKEVMKEGIDYVIYEEVLEGKPSTIVKLINGREEIVKR